MKKRFISTFLAILMMCAFLSGCLEKKTQETEKNVSVPVDTFEAYYAVITQNDLVLRKEPATTAEILSTVQAGEQLLVQDIVTVDDVQWASTDRGWIPAEYVRLQADMPKDDTANATVAFDGTLIYTAANPTTPTGTSFHAGDRVTVTEISYYGADVMARTADGWIKFSKLLFDGCTVSGRIPGVMNIGCANIRNGPSTDYDIIGNSYENDALTVKGFYNSVLNGKPWALLEDGSWLFVEYITFPEGVVFVKGENGNYVVPLPEKETFNEALLGTWRQYDRAHFLTTSYVKCDGFTFYDDGSFISFEGHDFDTYNYEEGAFYAAQGGYGEGGTYTVSGNSLVLNYKYLWYAGEQEHYEDVRQEKLTFTISGAFMTLNDGSMMVHESRCEDGQEILYDIMEGGTAGYIDTAYVGDWVCDSGETLTLNEDGTFSEFAVDGNQYTGVYMTRSDYGNYFLLYRKTQNGRSNRSVLYIEVFLSGDGKSMTLSPVTTVYETDYPSLTYTKAGN